MVSSSTDRNEIYRSAIIYARQYRLPIFPSSKDKIPLIKDWWHQSSKDVEVITGWWEKWPDANVSMSTGGVSGFIVLDVDVKNDQPGFENLRELEIKYGVLPKTPATITPSGGQHFIFKYNGPPLCRKISFLPGLDLMAEKSQILLPPSVGKSGKRYTWDVTAHIDEISFAPLPEWLTKLNNSSDNSNTTGNFYLDKLIKEGALKGQRNTSVTQIAGYLLRRYVHPYLALEFVLLWNKYRNTPPLPEAEVVRTMNSIAGKELRRRTGGVK